VSIDVKFPADSDQIIIPLIDLIGLKKLLIQNQQKPVELEVKELFEQILISQVRQFVLEALKSDDPLANTTCNGFIARSDATPPGDDSDDAATVCSVSSRTYLSCKYCSSTGFKTS
jgi:hypothetical protein